MRRLMAAALLLLVGCVKAEICDNQVDDDGNGRIDCADAESCSADDACAVVCGNDRIDNGEQCDGAQLNGSTCFSLGQGNGTLSCNNLCLFDISQCVAGPECGDGIIDVTEECDDNNGSNGDGCDNNCTNTACGNEIVTAGEQCDDGNLTNTDGCDLDCQFEVVGSCGDGSLNAGEQCDDNNNTNGDGCSSTCQNEGAVCGNGTTEGGEQCDDGNVANGDGCSSTCTTEGGANICAAPLAGVVGTNSGNTNNNSQDLTDGSCQDVNAGGGGGKEVVFSFTPTTTSINLTLASASDQGLFVQSSCSAAGAEIDCIDAAGGGTNEVLPLSGLAVGTPIFIFVSAFAAGDEGPFTLTIAAGGGAVCGNNTVEAGEQCDDGNAINTDACTNICKTAVCGDGFTRAGTETCDDGNTASGDGCSSTCATEVVNTGGLVINEVDYDQAATDATSFIEIFNGSNASIPLANLAIVLVNGGNNTEYARFALSGAGASLAPGQFLVVANTNVTVPGGAIKFVPTGVANTDFMQNGAPDAVALINTSNNTLIDALSYEGSITAATITGFAAAVNLVEGTAFATADTNDNLNSLSRSPNGQDTNNASADWALATPTPGAAN